MDGVLPGMQHSSHSLARMLVNKHRPASWTWNRKFCVNRSCQLQLQHTERGHVPWPSTYQSQMNIHNPNDIQLSKPALDC